MRNKRLIYSILCLAAFALLGFQLVIYEYELMLDLWSGRMRAVTRVLGITTSDELVETWVSQAIAYKMLPGDERFEDWRPVSRTWRSVFRKEKSDTSTRIDEWSLVYLGRVLNQLEPPAIKQVAAYWLSLFKRPQPHDLSKESPKVGIGFRYVVALVEAIQSAPAESRFDVRWVTAFNERYSAMLNAPFAPKVSPQ